MDNLSKFTDQELFERWKRDSVEQRKSRQELENRGYVLQFMTPNTRVYQSASKLSPHAHTTEYRFRKVTTIEELLS